MAEISGSFSTGKVNVKHDFRTTESKKIPGNVDRSLIKDNVTLVDELHGKTPEEYINDLYKPAIDEYNFKQKREDRRIHLVDDWQSPLVDGRTKYKEYSGYCDFHKDKLCGTLNRENELLHEAVLQIGEHETTGRKYYEADDQKKGPDGKTEKERQHDMYVKQYGEMVQKIQEKYPHIRILWATIHFDEPNGTPHVHLGYFGDGSGFKQGLSRRASLCRALTLDGIPRAASRSAQEGFQQARWYRQIHEEIIKPEILEHTKDYEAVLGEPVSLKAYQGGKHIPTRLLNPDWKQNALNELADQKAEVQKESDDLEIKHKKIQDDQEKLDADRDELAQKETDLAKKEKTQNEVELFQRSQQGQIERKKRELDEKIRAASERETIAENSWKSSLAQHEENDRVKNELARRAADLDAEKNRIDEKARTNDAVTKAFLRTRAHQKEAFDLREELIISDEIAVKYEAAMEKEKWKQAFDNLNDTVMKNYMADVKKATEDALHQLTTPSNTELGQMVHDFLTDRNVVYKGDVTHKERDAGHEWARYYFSKKNGVHVDKPEKKTIDTLPLEGKFDEPYPEAEDYQKDDSDQLE